MPKQKPVSLQQLKSQMATEEEKRNAVIEKGARAYHLGIEKHNNPMTDLSTRNLWNEGYDRAKKKFEAMFSRRGDTMRRE